MSANSQSILSDMQPSKAIVRLAIPATLALLAKAIYNLADTAYIGMLNSDIALTAVGVTVIRQGLFYVPFILTLPRLFGVGGIYAAQPAADVLTLLVCILSVPSMKRIASRNMQGASGQ